MTENKPTITVIRDIKDIRTPDNLKSFMATNYLNQIKNFFSDEKQAMKFMSSMMSAVQKNEDLMKCEMHSVVTSFMTMAQLGLMPSDVSGEAYVIPYGGKAQFQLGYQGLVTLFYRAGGQNIRAEIVRKNDVFSYENGQIQHKIDIFKSNADRGEIVGAYAIATVNGGEICKAMNITDIIDIGKKFSKSFTTKFSPWNTSNDPEGWMYKKTVLKQLAKMLPKNETIFKAIAEDNNDSIIADRLNGAMTESKGLQMGELLKNNDKNKEDKAGKNKAKDTDGVDPQAPDGEPTIKV